MSSVVGFFLTSQWRVQMDLWREKKHLSLHRTDIRRFCPHSNIVWKENVNKSSMSKSRWSMPKTTHFEAWGKTELSSITGICSRWTLDLWGSLGKLGRSHRDFLLCFPTKGFCFASKEEILDVKWENFSKISDKSPLEATLSLILNVCHQIQGRFWGLPSKKNGNMTEDVCKASFRVPATARAPTTTIWHQSSSSSSSKVPLPLVSPWPFQLQCQRGRKCMLGRRGSFKRSGPRICSTAIRQGGSCKKQLAVGHFSDSCLLYFSTFLDFDGRKSFFRWIVRWQCQCSCNY